MSIALPRRTNPMSQINRSICLVTLFAALNTPAGGQESKPGKQLRVSDHIATKVHHNYLLYLPKNYGSGAKFPLLLFLHGAGERGDDKLDLVTVHGPPKLIEGGEDFPFIVVSPQCKEGSWWEAAELSVLVDHIESQFDVDKDRLYVTGLSMGGFGTWALAQWHSL